MNVVNAVVLFIGYLVLGVCIIGVCTLGIQELKDKRKKRQQRQKEWQVGLDNRMDALEERMHILESHCVVKDYDGSDIE